MKLITVLTLTVLSFLPSHACYNETHVNRNGKQTNRSEPMTLFYNEPDKAEAGNFLAVYDLHKIKKDLNVLDNWQKRLDGLRARLIEEW